MRFTSTDYKYIQLDAQQIPYLEGTSMKVVELITSVKAYNWSPEELLDNYPHLSLSKIYSALAYYWDHQEEIEIAIAQREQYASKLQNEAGESLFIGVS
ncbi:MAG: DUF433 domain-containing protein [Oscillatoria sp. PMC 1068.18]|nr:DUF433 domain-containing protein [Oscillatoria sp. PMC 1076.18]MEC4987422.1 DUF433 domain-containing protein [Oscillatoria sp. PMC 1068.18]